MIGSTVITTPIIDNPRSFHAEARYARSCANCGAVGKPFEAHHVLKKQTLRKRGLPQYDTRGAVRLCEGLDTAQCHHRIEKGGERLPTERLSQVNICYLWDVLGPAAVNELDRHYTGVERRFTLHQEGRCPHCQPRP